MSYAKKVDHVNNESWERMINKYMQANVHLAVGKVCILNLYCNLQTNFLGYVVYRVLWTDKVTFCYYEYPSVLKSRMKIPTCLLINIYFPFINIVIQYNQMTQRF